MYVYLAQQEDTLTQWRGQRERETETEIQKETERETDRQTEREIERMYIHMMYSPLPYHPFSLPAPLLTLIINL